jgi:transcriptional regulatory protein RtcR
MRMATLAEAGRITVEVVQDEIQRLQTAWQGKPTHSNLDSLLSAQALADIDLFDRMQLDAVIETCRSCATLAEAGRKLFAASRTRRRALNDSDRLKKYLARFNLDWAALRR